ncbi:hypothetical protein So717_21930 [Roseobacter cerasinus]|uniref:Uncharacterized protein n=1 Tax=Roseobacter cerasinus TaxID=2602289 RepID=A0A640VSN5_9RHOB|nr:hypothetical protein [Roseobacter cerasinus]GFE50440.1 hypothetical protein So717_21930 [Roseobacter cerasinus]
MRASDRELTRAEVEQLTDGRTLIFFDEGRSRFSAGGAYSYTYVSGESAFGRYRVEQDGTVCIDYRNGFSRCDRYVESSGRIVMLTQKGERFPIRAREPE